MAHAENSLALEVLDREIKTEEIPLARQDAWGDFEQRKECKRRL